MATIFDLSHDWQQIENFFTKHKSQEEVALNAIQNAINVFKQIEPFVAPLASGVPALEAIITVANTDVNILQAGVTALEAKLNAKP